MAEEIHASAQDKPEEVKLPGADLFDWLLMVMGCILAAVLLFNCFARLTQVDGESMTNTLQDGEMMLVWSLGYHPKAGDIVVVNKKTATFLDDRAIVKRVIAVGGQSVDIDYASGTVYVDGSPLDEPYIKETMYFPASYTMSQTHWDVPQGQLFLMGDNRNGSTDSRFGSLGMVDTDYVLGRAVCVVFPFSDFKSLL